MNDTTQNCVEKCVENALGALDCISRQAVLSYIDRILNQGTGKQKSFEFIEKYVENLPSVTPTENCISRQAVLDLAEKGILVGNHNYKSVCNAINDLPSVTLIERIGHWIPVSERLPKDSELVLFSTKTDRVFEGRYFADNTDHQWYAFRDECFAWNNVVTAWMPLPKSYKAESEDKG